MAMRAGLTSLEKVRLLRAVLGGEELTRAEVIERCEKLGYDQSMQIGNWLARLAKEGKYIRKVRRGLYAAGPVPVPRDEPRKVPAPLPPAPPKVVPWTPPETAPPREVYESPPVAPAPPPLPWTGSVVGVLESGEVDEIEASLQALRWLARSLHEKECPHCGSVDPTGPALAAVKEYRKTVRELALLRDTRRKGGLEETVHQQAREIELLERKLAAAEKTIERLRRAGGAKG